MTFKDKAACWEFWEYAFWILNYKIYQKMLQRFQKTQQISILSEWVDLTSPRGIIVWDRLQRSVLCAKYTAQRTKRTILGWLLTCSMLNRGVFVPCRESSHGNLDLGVKTFRNKYNSFSSFFPYESQRFFRKSYHLLIFSCKIPLHFSREMSFYNCQESPSENFENTLTRPEILPNSGALLGTRGSSDLAYLFEV